MAEEIGDLPTGENPQDIEAMDIIRRAAQKLKEAEATQDDAEYAAMARAALGA